MTSYGTRDGRVDVELGMSWSKREGIVQHRFPHLAKASEEIGASVIGAVQSYGHMLSPSGYYEPVEFQPYMPSAKTRRMIGSAVLVVNSLLVAAALTPPLARGFNEIFIN